LRIDFRLQQLAAGLCLSILGFSVSAGTGYAAEDTIDHLLPASRFYTHDTRAFMLAANDTESVKPNNITAPVTPAAEFEPPLLSGSKAHQYLGIGTVALAGLTAY
jgi:hypothetical protein